MSLNEHPLPLPEIGSTMDASGLFGIERDSDGLLRATGPQGRRAKIGVNDDVAHTLALFWQPDSDDLAAMLANGEQAEALNEAFQFVVSWDRMAPGEIHLAFLRDHPEIPTLWLPDVGGVECFGDGLFHMVDEATNEASTQGVFAHVAAEIISDWGGLNAAVQHAREYQAVGSIAEILCERWDFEAVNRKTTRTNGGPRRQGQRRKSARNADSPKARLLNNPHRLSR
jgi:hypothetical protein